MDGGFCRDQSPWAANADEELLEIDSEEDRILGNNESGKAGSQSTLSVAAMNSVPTGVGLGGVISPMRSSLAPPIDGRYQCNSCNEAFLLETADRDRYTMDFHAHRMKETPLANAGVLKVSRLDNQCFMYERELKKQNPKIHINMMVNHMDSQASALALEAIAPLMLMHNMRNEGSLSLDYAVDSSMRSTEILFFLVKTLDVTRRKNVLTGLGLRSKENDALCESTWSGVDPKSADQPLLFGNELMQQLFNDTTIVLKNCEKLKQLKKGSAVFCGGSRRPIGEFRRGRNSRENNRSYGDFPGTSGYVLRTQSGSSRGGRGASSGRFNRGKSTRGSRLDIVNVSEATFTSDLFPIRYDTFSNVLPAGRLRYFDQNWSCITSDSWILSAIRGYRLEFYDSCPPVQDNPPGEIPFVDADFDALTAEFQSMLEKGAIEMVDSRDQSFDPGFESQLFIIPKKDGGLRPIINLKKLNTSIECCHFKMEGIYMLKDILMEGDYL